MFLKDVPEEKKEKFLKACFDYYSKNCYDSKLIQENPFQVSQYTLLKYVTKYLQTYQKEIEAPLSFLKISKPNFILKEAGCKTNIYVLYRNEREKRYVAKYCYQTYLYQNSETLTSVHQKLGCEIEKIKILALWYARNIKGLKAEEITKIHTDSQAKMFQEKQKEYIRSTTLTYDKKLKELMNLETDQEIIAFFSKKDFKILYFYERIYPFVMLWYPTRKDFLVDDLKRKIKIYYNYLKSQKKELKDSGQEKNITQAKKIMKNFLEDTTSKTKEEFCTKEKITVSLFNQYLKLLQQEDETLYNEASQKLKQNSVRYYIIQKQQVNEILYFIREGIEENGQLRSFNLLDYYFHTKMDFKDFNRILKQDHTKEEITFWKIFEQKYRNIPKLSTKSILNTAKIINCALDENNRPIKGTGRLVTREEKLEVISWLNKYRIPINQVTYQLAFERLQKELLPQPESKLSLEKKKP